ncbi:MAG: PilZ domain-containing protein [bacterium]
MDESKLQSTDTQTLKNFEIKKGYPVIIWVEKKMYSYNTGTISEIDQETIKIIVNQPLDVSMFTVKDISILIGIPLSTGLHKFKCKISAFQNLKNSFTITTSKPKEVLKVQRRKYPRIKASLKIKYYLAKKPLSQDYTQEGVTESENVSAGGIGIWLPFPVNTEEEIKLSIFLQYLNKWLNVKGIIKSNFYNNTKKKYLIGLVFVEIDPSQQSDIIDNIMGQKKI